MIRAVRAAFAGPLMVIIRPRGYDFLYADDEMDVMIHDIGIARDEGADGIVIGCLTPEGRVDAERCGRLVAAADPLDITFHRAFDMARDLPEAMEEIILLGIRRILSSGGQADVPSGISVLAQLVRQAAGRVAIMPGGGVTEDNIAEIVRLTGAREMHLSARHPVRGGMIHFNHGCFMGVYSRNNEYAWREASAEIIRVAKDRMQSARRPSKGLES